MTQISVTRALSQLKTLDKRIDKSIRECQPSAIVVGNKLPTGFASDEELKRKLQSNLDTPRDLIKHRAKIKQAIVMSNATTKVTIGGQEMTVAEAIESKASIEKQKDLLEMLQQYQSRAQHEYDRVHNTVSEKADKSAEVVLGGESDKKGDDYQDFIKKYMATNGPRFLKADNLATVIETLDKDITKFEGEVDYVLSESNATTMIEVDDAAL